jgi:molybdopterin converting factor small subunit
MKITLKLYATLMDCLPPGAQGNQATLEVEPGTTVQALLDRFSVPPKLSKLVFVNGVYVVPAARAAHLLAPDDELAAWPPIAGG